jgi:sugar/nucleoside kinase (ribokinase family)
MECHIVPAPESTTFENIYDADGNRTQHLHGRAQFLTPAAAPKFKEPPSIVHLGPIMEEVSFDFATAYPGAMVCTTPQGWMRQVDSTGTVFPKRWDGANELLPQCQAVVFSEEDLGCDETEIQRTASLSPISVCTRNKKGATLFIKGQPTHIPSYKATVIDPTGAGDVFAAAFFIWLKETDDPVLAVKLAHIAAAQSIEGQGISHIRTRDEILKLYNDSI